MNARMARRVPAGCATNTFKVCVLNYKLATLVRHLFFVNQLEACRWHRVRIRHVAYWHVHVFCMLGHAHRCQGCRTIRFCLFFSLDISQLQLRSLAPPAVGAFQLLTKILTLRFRGWCSGRCFCLILVVQPFVGIGRCRQDSRRWAFAMP
jgi:hypothetical protein